MFPPVAGYNLCMDIAELRERLLTRFYEQDFELGAAAPLNLDLLFFKDGEAWGLVLCPDREEGMAYLGAFETAMQRVIDARQAEPKLKLGLGLAFASTAQGQAPSYRQALKKYSNSVVFEDLGLYLFLITGEKAIDMLKPQEINPFLRGLEKWIAERKPKSA